MGFAESDVGVRIQNVGCAFPTVLECLPDVLIWFGVSLP